MHFREARSCRLGLAVVFALASTSPALAGTAPVRVLIPAGLNAGFSVVSASKVPGQKYVSVEDVRIFNPSAHMPQSFTPDEFHLLAGDRTYEPVVRPGYAAVDLHESTVLAPHQGVVQTVSFLIPDAVTDAKFEFVPHWFDDAGAMVDYCCFYL